VKDRSNGFIDAITTLGYQAPALDHQEQNVLNPDLNTCHHWSAGLCGISNFSRGLTAVTAVNFTAAE
jgi:hypothetical protein